MNLHRLARTCPASRALLVERVRQEGWDRRKAAEAAGVSVRTVAKWLGRHRLEGMRGLLDRSSRPHQVPNRTPMELEELVLTLRRQRLTGKVIATRLRMGRATVARILARLGLSKLRDLEPKVPIVRYERHHPGELVHVDIKKLGRFRQIGHRISGYRRGIVRGSGWEYVHVCVDDASRVSYVEVLADEKAPTVVAFVRRAVAWFLEQGVRVQRVMTDNGPGYLSRLFRALMSELGTHHIRTKPYHPRTNGKAERFIQTLLREWAYAVPYATSSRRRRALGPWLRRYNHKRPHSALAGLSPWTKLKEAA